MYITVKTDQYIYKNRNAPHHICTTFIYYSHFVIYFITLWLADIAPHITYLYIAYSVSCVSSKLFVQQNIEAVFAFDIFIKWVVKRYIVKNKNCSV